MKVDGFADCPPNVWLFGLLGLCLLGLLIIQLWLEMILDLKKKKVIIRFITFKIKYHKDVFKTLIHNR